MLPIKQRQKQQIKPVHLNFIRVRHRLDITQIKYVSRLAISVPLVGAIESGRCQPRIEVISRSLELGNIPKEDLHDFIYNFNYTLSNY